MNWDEPYGPLIETRVRVLTWNVWGEYGPYAERSGRIEKLVGELSPDVVALQEQAGQRLRMLTGRSAPAAPGLVFYDAWEVAGDGGPGHTWGNANPWARPGLYPDRRFDYVLSAWPKAGGAGHPVRCEVVGDGPDPASDHYAVLAELRY
ncbi:endonuclease/exonuclease/phosphatase family protein [Nonomuraea sp. NPDC050404]|uniref:endonuclease/exonuclease/phosphatase family protein n=1 Tax=Nonomuraea sp. NPDC050404 TaxID=3155783 RepID=UPI0033F55ACB